MSYIVVAADAGDFLSLDLSMRGNVFDNLFVAVEACFFRDAAVARFDANGVWKFAGSESERMPETVIGFHPVFAEEIVWSVTIVAGGNRPMAGLDPGIEMILHDVAIGAGFGIAGEVRATLGVNKSERTNSAGDTDRSADDDPFNRAGFHPLEGE